MTIAFHGAAGTVTGSCVELRVEDRSLLIDCGLFQGSRALEHLNHQPLPFDPARIDAVLLTHAHLDHSGRLPLLTRLGCSAPILCTAPTAQILSPLLLDAAKLQAADARRRNQRPDRAGLPPFQPLYDARDVQRTMQRVSKLRLGEEAEPLPGVTIRMIDAHHILGAASIEVRAVGQRLLFSGDIGPHAADEPLLRGGFDHLVCEATYGDRDRVIPTLAERREQLAVFVEQAMVRGGNLLIPAFALERAQALVGDLVALFDAGRLAPAPVFVDSPLAERVTRAYRRYASGPDQFDLDHPQVRFTSTEAQSRALDRLSGAIIIAGSGMCTGGRIRHHLIRNLPRDDSTVLIVGYQAHGTLGSVLQSGAHRVRISGNEVRVRATIETTDIYSGHADRGGLLRWLERCAPVRGSLFLNHGEETALATLSRDAEKIAGLATPIVPKRGESFALEAGTAAVERQGPRIDAEELVSATAWRSRRTAFSQRLEEALESLPSDSERVRLLDRAEAALGR